ncbi:hypothetical protein BU24DRAFT_7702 [Aaosphaeria arxii CBS 175.79]|uniref:Uncharacterized protein n=1 Tax=Aaosphaeria arxii CBS 175.79 TaxID=1450172 RepID=A0A6A5Y5A5_9PLEO|nr:uncharacterized protein BU24DRAFT_7702 [Aaosphaeria arxii CBS 175.79]KAF2020735.1 hypothetical protein BU24DRAFT_7702 [Aaosphaeria arxii CBS 175.79]
MSRETYTPHASPHQATIPPETQKPNLRSAFLKFPRGMTDNVNTQSNCSHKASGEAQRGSRDADNATTSTPSPTIQWVGEARRGWEDAGKGSVSVISASFVRSVSKRKIRSYDLCFRGETDAKR